MKKLRTLTLVTLGAALVASLTTTAKADVVQEFSWVQGPGVGTAAADFFGGAFLNPSITSVGNLTYDETTKTISGYTFDVAGAINIVDNLVQPVSPDSILLGDNLHLSPVLPGNANVASVSGITSLVDGNWIDDLVFDPSDQNYFETSAGGAITGDWVPVPEASTIIAGLLILVPFGVSAARILRNKRSLTA